MGIFSKQIQDLITTIKTNLEKSDWNSTSGINEILNKPTDVTDLSIHSATELNDITSAGSGLIITSSERTDLNNNTIHSQTTSGNPHNVTKNDIGLSNVDNVQQIPLSQKGANNGVAELDGNGKVPSTQLPAFILGKVEYKGTWNATTNTPTLGDNALGGTQGDYYVVNVAGTTSIDGQNDWQIGDWLVNNGSTWDKIDNTDLVTSVNSQTGIVVLDADDIDDSVTTNKFTTQTDIDKLVGIEAGAEVNVNADWNSTSGDSLILNKPTDITDLSTHSVTELNDISSAGSGSIITTPERSNLSNQSGTNTGDEVQATESILGIAEIATQTEVDTGTDDTRIVTPLKLAGLGGLGASKGLQWTFTTSTTDTDPGAAKFKFNNATQSSATFIYIDDLSRSGVNMDSVFQNLAIGDRFYIQGSVTTRYFLVRLTAQPIDGTGYWKLPIVVESSNSAILNNSRCDFRMFFVGDRNDVNSVFSRTGVVVAENGDYDASQVTNAFDLTTNTTDDIVEGGTNFFHVNSDWNSTSGKSEILNKPIIDELINSSVVTTNSTTTTIDTIDTLTDNSTHLIEVRLSCKSDDDTEYGTWYEILNVTKFNGTTTIRNVDTIHHYSSVGLKSNDVSFAVTIGNLNIEVTGITATNIQWDCQYIIKIISTN